MTASSMAADEEPLYTFQDGADGAHPYAGLIADSAGNLYGTTMFGGDSACSGGCGTVFQLTRNGSVWTETIIHQFRSFKDGMRPEAALAFDSSGNLYGTTLGGGVYKNGIVFQLTPSNGSWRETVLYSFTGAADGALPATEVVADARGNLYGTTSSGGVHNAGTVFLLANRTGVWREKVLYAFTGGNDGGGPTSGLIFDRAGNLYGTAGGGANGNGVVYRLTPTGTGKWEETVLHTFGTADRDGYGPVGGLVFDSTGNLYGMTRLGPGKGYGTIYRIALSLTSRPIETILYGFSGGDDGRWPVGRLAFDEAGNLYGTTNAGGAHVAGTIFKLSPISPNQWTHIVLYQFDGGPGGYNPLAGVIVNAGQLYGTTSAGGTTGAGVVFEVQ